MVLQNNVHTKTKNVDLSHWQHRHIRRWATPRLFTVIRPQMSIDCGVPQNTVTCLIEQVNSSLSDYKTVGVNSAAVTRTRRERNL